MSRLKGLPSLIVIVVVVWAAMRLIHVIVPVVQPEVLPGPFNLQNLSEVRPITGFSAHLPLYHPESLGRDPVTIIVVRRPDPQATITWRDDRFLELVERPVDAAPFTVPDDAEAVSDGQLHIWRRGEIVNAAGTVRGIQLSLRTDLSREDVLRIISTLVPLEEVK